MKVLSSSNCFIRQSETHKTECIHGMGLRPFTAHTEIDGFPVNQKDLYRYTGAVADKEYFAANLSSILEYATKNEQDDETAEINSEMTQKFFSTSTFTGFRPSNSNQIRHPSWPTSTDVSMISPSTNGNRWTNGRIGVSHFAHEDKCN